MYNNSSLSSSGFAGDWDFLQFGGASRGGGWEISHLTFQASAATSLVAKHVRPGAPASLPGPQAAQPDDAVMDTRVA